MTAQFQFGLIGRNINYSRSVDIFEAIFDHCRQPGRFELFSLEPEDLHSQLRQLTLNGFRAFSVTIPYKHSVIPALDEIDCVAQRLQAVNSIVVASGRLLGYNTDGFGFSLPLTKHSRSLRSGVAVVIGCGGAAKAVMYALCSDLKVQKATIVGRSAKKLVTFTSEIQSFASGMQIDFLEWSDMNRLSRIRSDILINCTPLGGPNHPGINIFERSGFPQCGIYYDLNYNEDNTQIALAAEHGAIAIDGSAMLVGQAVRSFDIWTGLSVPVEKIYRRVFAKELVV